MPFSYIDSLKVSSIPSTCSLLSGVMWPIHLSSFASPSLVQAFCPINKHLPVVPAFLTVKSSLTFVLGVPDSPPAPCWPLDEKSEE